MKKGSIMKINREELTDKEYRAEVEKLISRKD